MDLLLENTVFDQAFAFEKAQQDVSLKLEDILSGVEDRYAPIGFTATFKQTSTIKAMDITDRADGRITVKRPGKMRWEYNHPEPQLIITDGKTLWVYKPEDHQVMVGHFPTFFGDGKGASFLSDMKLIREKFNITLESASEGGNAILKLVPQKGGVDISYIDLVISCSTYDIRQITTYNTAGDETRISLDDIQFRKQLDDSLFELKIEGDIDVIQLDE